MMSNLDRNLYADTTIKCIDGDLQVHKLVLLQMSDYFKMFYTVDMQTPEHPQLKFPLHVVTFVVDFLYYPLNFRITSAEYNKTLTFNNVIEIIECCHFLTIPDTSTTLLILEALKILGKRGVTYNSWDEYLQIVGHFPQLLDCSEVIEIALKMREKPERMLALWKLCIESKKTAEFMKNMLVWSQKTYNVYDLYAMDRPYFINILTIDDLNALIKNVRARISPEDMKLIYLYVLDLLRECKFVEVRSVCNAVGPGSIMGRFGYTSREGIMLSILAKIEHLGSAK